MSLNLRTKWYDTFMYTTTKQQDHYRYSVRLVFFAGEAPGSRPISIGSVVSQRHTYARCSATAYLCPLLCDRLFVPTRRHRLFVPTRRHHMLTLVRRMQRLMHNIMVQLFLEFLN